MKAIVTATKEQLKEIGIDEKLTNKEVVVTDLDKFGGMYAPCSTITVKKLYTTTSYVVPTVWLYFIK